MTSYKVLWEKEAVSNLKSLSFAIVSKLMTRVESYLTKNPKNLGKPLIGKYKGYYRYRFRDYRIIYEIDKQEKL